MEWSILENEKFNHHMKFISKYCYLTNFYIKNIKLKFINIYKTQSEIYKIIIQVRNILIKDYQIIKILMIEVVWIFTKDQDKVVFNNKFIKVRK